MLEARLAVRREGDPGRLTYAVYASPWTRLPKRVRSQRGARATDEAADPAARLKHVHVYYGTPRGTIWQLSDDSTGAVLSIPVPDDMVTPEAVEETFRQAVFPVSIETSSDGGKTWVQDRDERAQQDWTSSIRRLYGLLGVGDGHWGAARILARTGEELVRHPPRHLQEIAGEVQAKVPGAQITLKAPVDQLFVRVGSHSFAVGTLGSMAIQWPIYVTPIGLGDDIGGSWECFTIDDVLSTLRYPRTIPKARVAPVAEIQAKSKPPESSRVHRRSSRPIEPPGPTIKIVPKFDANDPAYKTRTVGSAYQEPIRPVQLLNGKRAVLIWIFPQQESSADWRLKVMHREGSWPLQSDERAALDDWLEHFAETEWPERTQLWPSTYVAKSEAWERVQEATAERLPEPFIRRGFDETDLSRLRDICTTIAGANFLGFGFLSDEQVTEYAPGINPGPPGLEAYSNRFTIAVRLRRDDAHVDPALITRLVEALRASTPAWMTLNVGTDEGDFVAGVGVADKTLI
jgi:hypothetical protein